MGLWIAALSGAMDPERKAEEKPGDKESPAEKPHPHKAFTIRVKLFWVAMVLVLALSLALMIVMASKYNELMKIKTPYEDPYNFLRNLLAPALARDDLQHGSSPQIATAVDELPGMLQDSHTEYADMKKKYRDLLFKVERSSPVAWKLHGRSLYYVSTEEKTWHDAENFCISRDAHLASILSEEEQNFISSQLQHAFWIGLTREIEKDTWKWSDGSKLMTQYWSDGQPSSAGLACATMVPSSTNRNWNREDCYKLYRWICKENLDPDTP